jgi:hypothetical protein
MLHLLMHLTQQSTLLQLGIEQIRALTTMFTVEDSSDNEFGDNHNGWETINNDGCNAMQWSQWQELEHQW